MTKNDFVDRVLSMFTALMLKDTGIYNIDDYMVMPFSWGKGSGCLTA